MDFTWLGIQICICWSQVPYKNKTEKQGRGSENQSVSGVTTICLKQRDTSPSHRVDQAVDCGMWSHSSSMTVWSSWILAGTGTRRRTRRSTASKHTQWVTCLVRMEELGNFQLPVIVYRSLQIGAVHYRAETWGDGGWMAPQWASGSRHGILGRSNCHW